MDLELTSTDELVDELRRRFDGLLVVTLHRPDQESEDKCVYYKGPVVAIGLAEYAQRRILDEVTKEK